MIILTVNVNYRSGHLFQFNLILYQTHLKKWLEVAAISQKSGQNKSNGQVIGQVSAERSTSLVFIFVLSFFPSTFFSFHEYAWLMQLTTIFDWRDLNVSRLSNRLRSKKQVLSHHCQSTVSLLSVCIVKLLYCTVLHAKGLIILD